MSDPCAPFAAVHERAIDPNVWSGRALQEDFSEFEGCGGLASMYPAFDWSLCAPGHHGDQRACDLINGYSVCMRREVPCSFSFLILSQNLGRLGVSTIRVESRGLYLAGLEGSAMSQDAPSNAGELIGERDGKDVVMQSLLCRFDPRLKPIALPMLWPHLDQHHPGRLDEQGAQIAIAPF